MAIWLVKAKPKFDKLQELRARVSSGELLEMRPFGRALNEGVKNARINRDEGFAYWEEEDYCQPPLAQERAAVLDDYFYDLSVIRDVRDEGKAWELIKKLPSLWKHSEITKN